MLMKNTLECKTYVNSSKAQGAKTANKYFYTTTNIYLTLCHTGGLFISGRSFILSYMLIKKLGKFL